MVNNFWIRDNHVELITKDNAIVHSFIVPMIHVYIYRVFIKYHCVTQIKIEIGVVFAVRKIICLHVFVVAWTFLPFFVAGSFVAFLLHVGFPFLLHQPGCKLSKAPISSKKKLFWWNSLLRNRLVFFGEITTIWVLHFKFRFL